MRPEPQQRGDLGRPVLQAPPMAPRQSQLESAPSERAPSQPPVRPAAQSAAPTRAAPKATERDAVETRPAIAARAAAEITQQEAHGGQAQAKQSAAHPTHQPIAAASDGDASEPAYSSSWHDQVPVAHKGVVSKGLIFVFGFLALFGAWAVLFPISSAVVSVGKVVSNGQNKLIQHPIGGVVDEIFVADGAQVKEGDLLIKLDPSGAQAQLSQLVARSQALQARKTRYQAEQNGSTPSFGYMPNDKETPNGEALRGGQTIVDEGAQASSEANQAMVDQQRIEFEAGRKRLRAQVDAITYQIETFKDQRSGLNARMIGGRRLLELTTRELNKVRPLAEEGYLPKARMWELEKTNLEQLTNVENISAEMDAMDQRIAESEARLSELSENDREKRSEELTKVLGELAEIRDQITASQTALKQTELRAPVSGTVVKLVANTKGGVVAPGTPMAEIVPNGAKLETEFRVPQHKKKHVYPGQKARIAITTFNRRTYDPIEAKVTYVSADTLLDEQTGENYFLARAEMLPNPEKRTGLDEVTPGMATEVYVLAEPRVFASYVLQPLVDSFNRAFREIN